MGVSLVYTKVIARSDARPVAWRDLTAELGPVRWPRLTISIIRRREKLVRLLHLVALPGERIPEPPPIDFRRHEAVVYALGPRSSTGYDVRVERVTDDGNRISIVLRELTPTLSRRVTAKLTFPYRLIVIPRTDKHIRFVLEGRP